MNKEDSDDDFMKSRINKETVDEEFRFTGRKTIKKEKASLPTCFFVIGAILLLFIGMLIWRLLAYMVHATGMTNAAKIDKAMVSHSLVQ